MVVSLFVCTQMQYQPDYLPYLNDPMTRLTGNVPYLLDHNSAIYDGTAASLKQAMRDTTFPFYQEYGLPIGTGMKKMLKSRYLKKHGVKISKKKLSKKLLARAAGGRIPTGINYGQRPLQYGRDPLLDAYLQKKVAKKMIKYHEAGITKSPLPEDMPLKIAKKTAKANLIEARLARGQYKGRTDTSPMAELTRLKSEKELRKFLKKQSMSKAERRLAKDRKRWLKLLRADIVAGRDPMERVVPTELMKFMKPVKKVEPESEEEGDELYLTPSFMRGEEGEEEHASTSKAELKKQEEEEMEKEIAAIERGMSKKPLSELEKNLRKGVGAEGLMSARGLMMARGLMSARGLTPKEASFVMAKTAGMPSGGFVGTAAAVATLAAPLVIEGVKWIAKKLGQKLSGSAIDSKVWMSALADPKPPKTAISFWKKVYRLAEKAMPIYFDNDKVATTMAKKFIEMHTHEFFDKSLEAQSAGRDEGKTRYTVADLLSFMAPGAVRKEIADAMPATAVDGGTILETMLDIAKSPLTKKVVSAVAKKAVPFFQKKISSFLSGSSRKKMKKAFGVAKQVGEIVKEVAEPAISEVKKEETVSELANVPKPLVTPTLAPPLDTKPLSPMPQPTTMLTSPAVGGSTIDSYGRRGRNAARVYTMAKKMPSNL